MDSPAADAFPHIQSTLLEFRAGKMDMDGLRVVADRRKGLVRIGRGEEGLVHFQWLDRTLNVLEEDQIIFPDEAVFEKVNQSAERVYILKFRTDDRKFFFWMQEPRADGDAEICRSVNLFLNQPLEIPDEDEPDASTHLQNFEDMVEDDISLRAGNMVGATTAAEATSDVTSSGPVKLADLQRILNNIGSNDEVNDPDAGLGLGDILKPDLILPLIGDMPLEQQLASHLPEGQRTAEEIIELLQSPPFCQQLDSFTYVLRTGQIDLTQFGIDPSKYKFTVPSFLEALEDSVSMASGESTRDQSDSRSHTNNSSKPMDEGK